MENVIFFENSHSLNYIIEQINIITPNVVFLNNVNEFDLSIGERGIKRLVDMLEGSNTHLYILFGTTINDGRYIETNNVHFFFWPTYELIKTYEDFKHNNIDFKIEKPFDKLYLNYTNLPKVHRCKLIDKLYCNDLFSYGINSWNRLSADYFDKKYEFEYWNEEVIKVDEFNNETGYVANSSILKTKSFINVITESAIHSIVFSEKTWKSVLIEQPFIVLGAQYQNTKIQELGFEIYDEIFDYSFDLKSNIDDRVKGIVENLINLKDMDYNELYDKIEPKLKRNKERMLKLSIKDDYIPRDFSDLYVKYNMAEIIVKSKNIPIQVHEVFLSSFYNTVVNDNPHLFPSLMFVTYL
jgi:hypothetical protein